MVTINIDMRKMIFIYI